MRDRWWGVFSSSNHNVCSKMTRARMWVNPPCLVHAEVALFHYKKSQKQMIHLINSVPFLFGDVQISSHSYGLLTCKNNFKKKKKKNPSWFLANTQTIFFLMFRDWFLNSFYWVSFSNPSEHYLTPCQRYTDKRKFEVTLTR